VTTTPAANDVADVAGELAASRKYRAIAPAALARVAREALKVARNRADALKRAKAKLHQIGAAFVTSEEIAQVRRVVRALPPRPSDEALRAACRTILRRHASTRERSEPDAEFYLKLWRVTGPPRSVVDLGCGLHPFALPWMGLARDCAYFAGDVDGRIAELVAPLFALGGWRGHAATLDLLAEDAPWERVLAAADATGASAATDATDARKPADVVLLMKLLPTLERQRTGAAQDLLERVRASYVVVTFPGRSLGGRTKGMVENYGRFVRDLADRARRGDGSLVEVRNVGEPTYVLRPSGLP